MSLFEALLAIITVTIGAILALAIGGYIFIGVYLYISMLLKAAKIVMVDISRFIVLRWGDKK